jgi:hypothetical protein
MWSWISDRLSSPPALVVGLLTWIAAGQALRVACHWIVLFPQRRAERLLGRCVWQALEAVTAGKPLEPAAGPDLSMYRA